MTNENEVGTYEDTIKDLNQTLRNYVIMENTFNSGNVEGLMVSINNHKEYINGMLSKLESLTDAQTQGITKSEIQLIKQMFYNLYFNCEILSIKTENLSTLNTQNTPNQEPPISRTQTVGSDVSESVHNMKYKKYKNKYKKLMKGKK